MCVMPPHLAALSFIVNKSGSAPGFERCAGIPATLKPEFVRLSTECPREVIILTPISKLYEAISVLTKPSGMMHFVEKRALSGEVLFQEISQLPTVFRKVEFEPVA